jgi:hypothetical protein
MMGVCRSGRCQSSGENGTGSQRRNELLLHCVPLPLDRMPRSTGAYAGAGRRKSGPSATFHDRGRLAPARFGAYFPARGAAISRRIGCSGTFSLPRR